MLKTMGMGRKYLKPDEDWIKELDEERDREDLERMAELGCPNLDDIPPNGSAPIRP